MIAGLCLLVAAALLFGVDVPKLKAWLEVAKTKVDAKKMLAAGLLIVAVLSIPSWHVENAPTPAPDSVPLSLRGDFRGETASEDAATLGNMLLELADELEWDGSQGEPFFVTGSQIDQLRKRARILRCRGESIGDRQTVARDKIASYLEAHVGTDGGQLTPQTRALWVSAFRDVGRAACDAAQ